MSLFGDLPEPTTKKREREPVIETEATDEKRSKPAIKSKPEIQQAGDVDVDINDLEELSEGNSSSDDDNEEDAEQPADVLPSSVPIKPPAEKKPVANNNDDTSAPQNNLDQVAAALLRLTGHLGNPKKFSKAAELLTKLFIDNILDKQKHGSLVFAALEAAMNDPQIAHEPTLARDYSKLFTVASKHAELFNKEQRAQLDVYGIWAVFRNKMYTDDSFAFNKVLSSLKQQIEELPKIDSVESEDAGVTAQHDTKSDTGVWSEAQCLDKRRDALIDCLVTGKLCYKNAWARTSIDALIDHAVAHRDRFTSSQQPRIDELAAFAREQKQIRKLGPSSKEVNRDTTSFERARAAWGDVNWISKRGKMGGGGDAKAQQWLG